MSYLNKEERHQKILQTAIQIAFTDGLKAITSRSIAQRAEISTGLLHHYYASISELRAQTVLHIFDNALQNDKKRSKASSSHSKLLSMITGENTHSKGQKYTSNQLWDEALFLATKDPHMKAACTTGMQAWHQEVVNIIQQGRKDGSFKSGMEANDLAWQLIGLCCGLEGLSIFESIAFPAEKLKRQLKLAITTLL